MKRTKWRILFFSLATLCLTVKATSAYSSPAVSYIELPARLFQPALVIDDKGSIHAVFTTEKGIFYTSFSPHTKTWQNAVRVSEKNSLVRNYDPRISVSPKGRLFIAWQEGEAIKAAWGNAGEVRSTNTFTVTEIGDNGKKKPEMPDIAFGADETLSVTWIDHRNFGKLKMMLKQVRRKLPTYLGNLLGESSEFAAADLWLAQSIDGGKTFLRNGKINSLPVCECCEPSVIASFRDPNRILVSHRSTVNLVKEIQIINVNATKNENPATQVSKDNWHFIGCPNAGAKLIQSADGMTVAVFWLAQTQLKIAISRDAGQTFGPAQTIWETSSHPAFAAINREGTIVVLSSTSAKFLGGVENSGAFETLPVPTNDKNVIGVLAQGDRFIIVTDP